MSQKHQGNIMVYIWEDVVAFSLDVLCMLLTDTSNLFRFIFLLKFYFSWHSVLAENYKWGLSM